MCLIWIDRWLLNRVFSGVTPSSFCYIFIARVFVQIVSSKITVARRELMQKDILFSLKKKQNFDPNQFKD
jgi:hypothetical protein